MKSNVSTPYAWLRQIPRSLMALDQIPLFGLIPPFPWGQFSEAIAHSFELNQVTIQATESQWRTKDNLYSDLSDDLVPLNLSIAGIDGSICWVLSKQDILNISAKVLRTESQELTGLDSDLEESFYRFLGFKIVQAIGELNWGQDLSIHILNRKELPQEDSFCVDIQSTIDQLGVHGRLILSPQFQKSLKQRFSDRSLERPEFKIPLSEKLETTIHLEIGHTNLKLSEWQKVKKGDFILLDDCSLREKSNGHVTITLLGVPFLTAGMKEGALKIIERPLHREVNKTMDKEPDDEEFEEFEDEEFEEFEEDGDAFEGDDEEFEDEASEVETENEADETAAGDDDGEHLQAKLEQSNTPLASPKEIPMHVVVEVGRLKMSVQKLMDLAPGNILDLNLSPEDGVDLTVNGRCIAKGELLKVGDVLGVRILDIG